MYYFNVFTMDWIHLIEQFWADGTVPSMNQYSHLAKNFKASSVANIMMRSFSFGPLSWNKKLAPVVVRTSVRTRSSRFFGAFGRFIFRSLRMALLNALAFGIWPRISVGAPAKDSARSRRGFLLVVLASFLASVTRSFTILSRTSLMCWCWAAFTLKVSEPSACVLRVNFALQALSLRLI